MFFRPATFANNNGGGPGPITDCEGLNNDAEFQHGCDVAVYSSDSVGQLWLSGGPSGSKASGRIAVRFNQSWPDYPICTVTPANLVGRWTPGASAIVTPERDQLTIEWSNAGSPLRYVGSGPAVGLNYHCFVLP
jgi:hypothetical protein